MELNMLKSKIHRATVTQAELNYIGSITIDIELLEEVGILEYEKVHIVNINNGQRFETYTIAGDRGSKVICLNGAAARCAQVGDNIIIMAYCNLKEEECRDHRPKVVFLGEGNEIDKVTNYEKHGPLI